MTSSNSGRLWIVATPLGNPEDLSPRARRVLAEAGLILAEDTRRAGKLLAACGISATRFASLHDHNEEARLAGILAQLREGLDIALVSDAGTPLLSDPGYLLVRACREHAIPVSPVPGPSAPITALSASGLPPMPFVFLGFPPRGKGDVKKFFSPYSSLKATLIFFERKDRLGQTLEAAMDVLGTRRGCLAREMTKTHEEFLPFTLDPDGVGAMGGRELLGEITVVLGPPETVARDSEDRVRQALAAVRERFPDCKPKDAARLARDEVCGWSVSEIYAVAAKDS